MAKIFQFLHRRSFKFQNPLEINPQLFREIKRKINSRNIFITSLLSMLIQLFVVVVYLGKLPNELPDIKRNVRYLNPDINIYPVLKVTDQYSRYCTGSHRRGAIPTEYLCHHKLDIWEINWNLFWHDIFTVFCIISVFILLIIGTYMIIADLVKEEKTGTLNFIRLSPQSASNILLGKILGVPILIYFFIASILPLHIISGIKANIPWYLILSFYIIVLASCGFFFSFSLFLSLIKLGSVKINPWIVTFSISFFIYITTVRFIGDTDIFFLHSTNIYNSFIEWSYLFNPIASLTYTYPQGINSISNYSGNYIEIIDSLRELLFYGQALWKQAIIGMGFILLNYCLWTYWFWQGATRLFHNPSSTTFSKKQSYWLTGWFVLISFGFTLQQNKYNMFFTNLIILYFVLFVFFLCLIAVLSPHRQTLSDWARYRHQRSQDSNLLEKELVFGEKSPSTIAIAINALIATIIILIGSTFFLSYKEIETMMWGAFLTMGMILLYAVIAQWMLLMKSNKRVLWTAITLALLIIILPVLFATAEAKFQEAPLVWFFSFMPAIAVQYANSSALLLGVLGQWLAITFVSRQLIKKLRQAGSSETQKLLNNHIT